MLDRAIKSTARGAQSEKSQATAVDARGGFVAGTLVATPTGWVPVECLYIGDMVMTFDDGFQQVTGTTLRQHPMPGGTSHMPALLSVPDGLIGNRRPILLPEEQPVIVDCDFAEQVLGDPFATMEASELLGLPGVRKVLPDDTVVVVTLSFERDQMIFVEGQALACCPASADAVPRTFEEAMWRLEDRRYHVLSHDDASLIVAGMSNGSDLKNSNDPKSFGAPPV